MIDRADALSELTDMASTDPLTGLPNRRAWDARVAGALAAGERFTIAMLDFDHFKEFNDTHGHPAGDRLLRDTTAAWREQVRSGDLLARLGGEEFGLLLINCDTPRATEVIERLRGVVYRRPNLLRRLRLVAARRVGRRGVRARRHRALRGQGVWARPGLHERLRRGART